MAGSGVRMGQTVRAGVGEGQQVAVALRHPPGRAGLHQSPLHRADAETGVEIGLEVLLRIGNGEPVRRDEGVEEGLAAQFGERRGIGVCRGADHGFGHSARLGP